MKLYDLETYHKRSVQEGWSTPELAKKVLEAYECCSVEAIPISWIKHFKEEMKNHIQDSVNQYTYMYDYLIDEWRKENE